MRRLEAEDLKQIDNLIKALKVASFKDVTGPQVLSLALSFQWLGELKQMVEENLKQPPVSQPSPILPIVQEPKIEEVPSKKKKK